MLKKFDTPLPHYFSETFWSQAIFFLSYRNQDKLRPVGPVGWYQKTLAILLTSQRQHITRSRDSANYRTQSSISLKKNLLKWVKKSFHVSLLSGPRHTGMSNQLDLYITFILLTPNHFSFVESFSISKSNTSNFQRNISQYIWMYQSS